jgi:hypothetical protein
MENFYKDRIMQRFLKRFLLTAAIVLVVSLADPLAHTQAMEQDSSASSQTDSAATPVIAPNNSNEAQMPASGEVTTQEVKSFGGIVIKEHNVVALQDPVTKVSYRLNDPAKANPYVGKRVKITGKLDTNSNTILITGIEMVS